MRFLRSCRAALLAILLGAAIPSAPVVLASDDPATSVELVLADVSVNGQAQGVTLLARDRVDDFYVDAATIERWRLNAPAGQSVEIDGRTFYALSEFHGLSTAFSEGKMALDVEVAPDLLAGTYRSLASSSEAPHQFDSIGGYLDYDVAYTRGPLSDERHLSGYLRPTVFTQKGSLTTDLLYNNAPAISDSIGTGWRRLATTWTLDDPDRMRSFRFGDALTPGSSWARAVRFGGFQIATNFETRPSEVTFPQPSISGTAAVPSTLDIYVNGQLRSQLDVPAGVFEVDNIPVVTGTGQVQVVARDLLGREQLLTQDFYSSERLLRPGLIEYSLSAGRLRRDFAVRSNAYGPAIVAANYRRGLSNQLTLGGQFSASGSQRVVDVSMARSFGLAGVMTASAALSSTSRAGRLWLVGHQFQGRRFRGDVRVQGTSKHFAQPGVEFTQAFPKRQISVSGGVGMRQHGSAGMSFVVERSHAGLNRRITSFSYSRSLPSRVSLSVAVSQVRSTSNFWEASFSVNRSLGPRTSTSASYYRRVDGQRTRLAHRYELPTGPGFGYRTSVQQGSQDIAEAEYLLNTTFAHYGAEYRNSEGDGAFRVQTRGALAHFDGAWFGTREIDNGFAVVDTGAYDDVGVYLENRPVGRTRADGRLLVPGLRPYEVNRLRIEIADLPVEVRVEDSLVTVSPYYRAGTLARFGLRATTSVLLRAVLPDSQPVPEGARAQVGESELEFPVGLDGRLFVEGIEPGDSILVRFENRRCRLVLDDITPGSAINTRGDVECREFDDAAEPSARQPEL